jgi:hypothetical protein
VTGPPSAARTQPGTLRSVRRPLLGVSAAASERARFSPASRAHPYPRLGLIPRSPPGASRYTARPPAARWFFRSLSLRPGSLRSASPAHPAPAGTRPPAPFLQAPRTADAASGRPRLNTLHDRPSRSTCFPTTSTRCPGQPGSKGVNTVASLAPNPVTGGYVAIARSAAGPAGRPLNRPPLLRVFAGTAGPAAQSGGRCLATVKPAATGPRHRPPDAGRSQHNPQLPDLGQMRDRVPLSAHPRPPPVEGDRRRFAASACTTNETGTACPHTVPAMPAEKPVSDRAPSPLLPSQNMKRVVNTIPPAVAAATAHLPPTRAGFRQRPLRQKTPTTPIPKTRTGLATDRARPRVRALYSKPP